MGTGFSGKARRHVRQQQARLTSPSPHFLALIIFSSFSSTLNIFSLPSATFWTSGGHRRLPFFPPVRAFIFIEHGVHSAFPISFLFSSILLEFCELTLSCFPIVIFSQEKVSTSTSVHSVRRETSIRDLDVSVSSDHTTHLILIVHGGR